MPNNSLITTLKNLFNQANDHSTEVITIGQPTPKSKHKFYDAEVQDVLSDFEKLDFVNNPCSNSSDEINYNEGKEANPFDKIAKYYGRKKNVFLFISMLRDEEQSKKIIDIIDRKCDVNAKEKFIERKNIYLARIEKGEIDAREFLKSNDFPGAFFNGYHVACEGHDRNIHENLNINITKPLEISSLFNSTTKRIEEKKSEVKRVKIYSNAKRLVIIEKNEKQQRIYSFAQDALCEMVITWAAKDESEKILNCTIILSISFGKISIKELMIDGKNAEPRKILELAKQNNALLIENKALHEILEESFAKQLSCEEKENVQSSESITPNSSLDQISIKKSKEEEPQNEIPFFGS